MRYRWRTMYQLTGLPGWIRFGYSPARSATGLPSTGEWLMSSWQRYMEQLRKGTPYSMPSLGIALTKEQEKEMLEQQAGAIESSFSDQKKELRR